MRSTGLVVVAAALLASACGSATSPTSHAPSPGESPSAPASAAQFTDPAGDVADGTGPDITDLAIYPAPRGVTLQVTLSQPPEVSTEEAADKDGLMVTLRTVSRGSGQQHAFAGGGALGPSLRIRLCQRLGCNEAFDSSRFVYVPEGVFGDTVAITLSDEFLLNPKLIRAQVSAFRMLGTTGEAGGDAVPDQGTVTYRVPA